MGRRLMTNICRRHVVVAASPAPFPATATTKPRREHLGCRVGCDSPRKISMPSRGRIPDLRWKVATADRGTACGRFSRELLCVAPPRFRHLPGVMSFCSLAPFDWGNVRLRSVCVFFSSSFSFLLFSVSLCREHHSMVPYGRTTCEDHHGSPRDEIFLPSTVDEFCPVLSPDTPPIYKILAHVFFNFRRKGERVSFIQGDDRGELGSHQACRSPLCSRCGPRTWPVYTRSPAFRLAVAMLVLLPSCILPPFC